MKLLLAFAILQSAAEECPAHVVLGGVPQAAAAASRAYADCMTLPHIPIERALEERRAACRDLRARQLATALNQLATDPRYRRREAMRRAAAEEPFAWIDHIASTLPACETHVAVVGDGSEIPDAQN